LSRFRSYEFRASCAGTNIGGALAGGSATLYNEGRREGSVWIMVLLSDGAAGASNPVYRIGADNIAPPQPYRSVTTPGGATAYSPLMGLGGPITGSQTPTAAAGYGAYGLCPYGLDGAATQLLSYDRFPYCSDLQPESRNFCGTVSVMPDAALNAGDPNCIHYYNVDDYARDWADWVAVAELPGSASGGSSGRVGDQLLPTIFTIAFGLNYDVARGTTTHTLCSDTDYACIRGINGTGGTANQQRDRNADYLGEELLRYVADVGDNFQIDSDYWQVQMGTRIENSIDFASSSPNWGPRGACEQDTWTGLPNDRGNVFLPTPPRESCGNYFVASTGAELEVVFNEIASRMFTRLSQ
jgi:hypothetical protein